MGGKRLFGESWTWATLEHLPFGVPFFAWDEGEMPYEDCAAMNSNKYFKLMCSKCDVKRYIKHECYYEDILNFLISRENFIKSIKNKNRTKFTCFTLIT